MVDEIVIDTRYFVQLPATIWASLLELAMGITLGYTCILFLFFERKYKPN